MVNRENKWQGCLQESFHQEVGGKCRVNVE